MISCTNTGHDNAEVDRLIKGINDHPDLLHAESTPAVNRLIDIGKPAIPALLEVIISGDGPTRMRAQAALELITLRMYGFQPGHGWQSNEGEAQWRSFWMDLGSLNWQDTADKRLAAVKLWRQWYVKQ